MRYSQALVVASGAFLGHVAAQAQYVTDLPAFTILPPCVATALSYNINIQTYVASCGIGEDELQECICSNSALRASVTSSISRDIATECGGIVARDEQSSASTMFNQYCTPNAIVRFPTPTTNIVSAYITDLSEMKYLPPCASEGLSYAVMKESQSRCPTEVSLFAPCVCTKDYIVSDVSEAISINVRSSCTNGEDVTSAYDFYDEYCRMNEGTSSFARPPGPPGDMTYHVTALPEFRSLNSCAQSAVSDAVFMQTYSYCGSGPQALASCVCIKSGMKGKVSSTLNSQARYYCDNTATDDIASAIGVFEYYCSAAEGDVVATVSVSGTETSSPAAPRTSSGDSSPSETGAPGGGDSEGQDDGSSDSGGNRTATIVGAVLGGVIGIALIIGIGFFIRHRKKKAAALKNASGDVPPYTGPPELEDNDSRTDMAKAGSPLVSAELGDRGLVEMPHQAHPSELHSQTGSGQHIAPQNAQELPSSPATSSNWPLQTPQRSNNVSPMTPAQHNSDMGWQSGPVETYEMDSTSKPRDQ